MCLLETRFFSSWQPVVDHDNVDVTGQLFSGNASSIRRSAITGPVTSPSITKPADVTVERYLSPPDASQPNGSSNLHIGGLKVRSRVQRIGGVYWGVQTVRDPATDNAAARWFKIDANSNTLIQEGLISDPTLDFGYASIAANAEGDVVISMSGSGPLAGQFLSTYAVVGSTSGDVTSFGTPARIKAGTANYQWLSGGRNRWGDYSATDVDPADPGIFWTHQGYATGTRRWNTRISEAIPQKTGESRWQTPTSGNFHATGNWFTGVPGANDHAIFSRQGASHTITIFSDVTNHQASVRQGDTTLSISGGQSYTLVSNSAAEPSLAVGEYQGTSHLTLAGLGELSTVNATIGAGVGSAAKVTVSGAAWNNVETIDVAGTGSAAELSINSGRVETDRLNIWPEGNVILSGGMLSAGSIDADGVFDFLGGTLQVDIFAGTLDQDRGTLSPGGSIGTTSITGGFNINAGTLAIELAGATQFDSVDIAGDASLAGLLSVELLGGFVPTFGNSFEILTSASLNDTLFDAISLPPLAGLQWDVVYGARNVTLSVVPEPTTGALWMAACLGLLLTRLPKVSLEFGNRAC